MKKIILSALVLSFAIAVNAQEIPDRKTEKPGMMQKKRHHGGGMEEFKALNLTEDQKTKLKTQHEALRTQMVELKKNDGITVKEWKEKAKSIHETHKAQVQSVLTIEQKAKLETLKKEAKARHGMDNTRPEGMDKREGTDKHPGMDRREGMDKREGMADHMKAELNLTADQSAKMQANRKAMGVEMKKIHENSALTDQQKKDQMMDLRKKQKETLKTILTAEQLQKLEQNSKGQRGDKKKPELNNKSI